MSNGDKMDIETLTNRVINRLKKHEPPIGYYLAFSGGKDSIVLYDIALKSGVKFDSHFSQTTVDPPEILKFIKKFYPLVIWHKPINSMFKLIVKKKILPTRQIRYCCSELKEIGGKNRTVLTGIRWDESTKRKKRNMYEPSIHEKTKWFLHPIIEWSDKEIWEYIYHHKLDYCNLYDEGYKRIGCIMCPMQGTKGMLLDAQRYPKYYNAYLLAIKRMMKACEESGKPWKKGNTPEDIMYWWIYGYLPVKKSLKVKK